MMKIRKPCINYFDANNLYGLSMIQTLPYKNLKWDDRITEMISLTIRMEILDMY